MDHLGQGDPAADQVVLDHLGGRDDDGGIRPLRGAVLRPDLSREHDDLIVGHREPGAVVVGVLGDERLGRG